MPHIDNEEHLFEVKTFPNGGPEEVKPISLTLDLTHRCNFKCAGCIEGKARSYSAFTDLYTHTACRIVRQFAEMGGEELLLYGGEPTLHEGFDNVIKCAERRMKLIRVVTNGSLLHKTKIAKVLKTASDETKLSVRVSLNAGTSATHELLHGVKGFFQKVLEGMKVISDSNVELSVSYLLEEANANEVMQAYEISQDCNARFLWLRPKTGLHGIGLVPLSSHARESILDAIRRLATHDNPKLHVEPWYLHFLETGVPPGTSKSYKACYYCGGSRLVVTPPDPGIVWSCTYWRGESKFLIADLSVTEFGSPEFERKRIEAIQRIVPWLDCTDVICNRDKANTAIWQRISATATPIT